MVSKHMILPHISTSHLAFLSNVPDPCTNNSTSGIARRKISKKKLHILTHGTMQGCELTSFRVCINGTTCDTRERNVTVRSEI
jgi:hypothetical protein